MPIMRVQDADGNWVGVPAIVGPKGPKGDPGADGTMRFEDLTDEQRETLKGPQGDKGDSGVWVGSEAPTDGSYKVWVDPTARSTDPSGNSVMTDRTTGKKYSLYVDNGKLMMEEVS